MEPAKVADQALAPPLPKRWPDQRWLVPAAAFGLLLIASAIAFQRHAYSQPLFWDMPVYVAGLKALSMQLDPYQPNVLEQLGVPDYLRFTTPPSVVYVLHFIASSPLRPLFAPFLIIAHLIAVIGTPIVLGRLFFGRTWPRAALAMGAFAMVFMGAGIIAFGAGNNGTVLYFLIACALWPGIERNDWRPFFAAVVVATAFKPFYAAFWIVPVCIDGFSWRRALIACLGIVLGAATFLGPMVLDPATFAAWQANLARQLFGLSDLGHGPFAAVKQFWSPATAAAVAVQFVYMLALAAFIFVGRMDRLSRLALLLVVAVFVNPRVYGYDEAFAAIPLVYLFARLLPLNRSFDLRLVAGVWLLTVLMFLPYRNIALVPPSILFPMVVLLIVVATALLHVRDGPRGNAMVRAAP